MLDEEVYPIGSRVRVANDSPFRGLKGTILAIHVIATPVSYTHLTLPTIYSV